MSQGLRTNPMVRLVIIAHVLAVGVTSACGPRNSARSEGADVQARTRNPSAPVQNANSESSALRISQGTWLKKNPAVQSAARASHPGSMCYLPAGTELDVNEMRSAQFNHSKLLGIRAMRLSQTPGSSTSNPATNPASIPDLSVGTSPVGTPVLAPAPEQSAPMPSYEPSLATTVPQSSSGQAAEGNPSALPADSDTGLPSLFLDAPQQVNANLAEACTDAFLQGAAAEGLFLYRPHFTGGPKPKFAGQFTWPVPASVAVNSTFQSDHRPNHNGNDFAADAGTPILAAAAGVVRAQGDGQAGQSWDIGRPENGRYDFGFYGFGLFAFIDHGNSGSDNKFWQSLYGHMQRVTIAQGAQVAEGDMLGEMGSTGFSTGSHLHFEVWRSGTRVDPQHYLARR